MHNQTEGQGRQLSFEGYEVDKKERRQFQANKIAWMKGFTLSRDLNALWFGDREEILGGKVEPREVTKGQPWGATCNKPMGLNFTL